MNHVKESLGPLSHVLRVDMHNPMNNRRSQDFKRQKANLNPKHEHEAGKQGKATSVEDASTLRADRCRVSMKDNEGQLCRLSRTFDN